MANHKIETPEEQAIIDAVKQGEYVSLPESELQSMASDLLQAAENTAVRGD